MNGSVVVRFIRRVSMNFIAQRSYFFTVKLSGCVINSRLSSGRERPDEEDLVSTLFWWLLVAFFALLATAFVVMLVLALTSPYLIFSGPVVLLFALVGFDLLCMFILVVYRVLTPDRQGEDGQLVAEFGGRGERNSAERVPM